MSPRAKLLAAIRRYANFCAEVEATTLPGERGELRTRIRQERARLEKAVDRSLAWRPRN